MVLCFIINCLIITDPPEFTRPKTLGVIPRQLLRQMKPLDAFMKLNVLTERQKHQLQNIGLPEDEVKNSIITYLLRNTNRKEAYETFVNTCEEPLKERIGNYLNKPPVNGNSYSLYILISTPSYFLNEHYIISKCESKCIEQDYRQFIK